jgi:hypothetical protein
MLDLEKFLVLGIIASGLLHTGPFAYVGLGPGQEFIPYFFGLLAFAATALIGVLQWPLAMLRRCLKKGREDQTTIPQQADE